MYLNMNVFFFSKSGTFKNINRILITITYRKAETLLIIEIFNQFCWEEIDQALLSTNHEPLGAQTRLKTWHGNIDPGATVN